MLETALKRVLVVDDDNLICWALDKEFNGSGLTSNSVENIADALEELKREHYDVVFLDIRLPDGDGIEILAEIGRISPESRTVVMSGNASEGNRQRAFERGAVKFLEKPFEISEAHAILRDALAGRLKKRRHVRNPCRVPLRITIVKPSPEEERYSVTSIRAVMADVGFGGFGIRTKYLLSVGQFVQAHVDPAGGDNVMKYFTPQTTAEVVWVAPSVESLTAGLKFVS
ncbi:MAG: response regulator [Deltaproteobacteria bacterium]|nr:response regulator [Deltaproteobacteria bacterium]